VSGHGLEIRPAVSCRYDIVALGEIMLRLDPGEGRIRNARSFRVWEGGGEYNVARGLRRCFGLRAAIVTAFVDNEIGRLLEDLVLAGGVDTSQIAWLPFDGTGRDVRNGLNFTERGFGVRGAVGVSDRAHTAAGRLAPGDVDWHDLFGAQGARWFHTGGIYAAISPNAPLVIAEAIEAARAHGVIVSYDLNYRPSLWRAHGGVDEARRVNRELVRQVDVVIGNEEDFTACLGLEIDGVDENLTQLDTEQFQTMIARAATTYPNLQIIATTLRAVHSATRNDWGAIAWSRTHGYAHATPRTNLEILDRVGGGDSFVAGLAYGLMELEDLALAVEYGAAHGALAMTTPGDTSAATLTEVEALANGAGARVKR
jgi:2-dehydro-3-deoxygluconokinase